MRLRDHIKGLIKTTEKIEAENVPERKQSVLHPDLFTFRVGSTVVADRHFVNYGIGFGNLGRHFDFDAETAGRDRHIADDVAAERLVSGFHIRHVQVRQHIRKHRQHIVGNIVVEVQHARCAAHHEARTIDDIGMAIENRLDDVDDFGRIVFQIRILDDDDVSCRVGKSLFQSRRLAAIGFVNDTNPSPSWRIRRRSPRSCR